MLALFFLMASATGAGPTPTPAPVPTDAVVIATSGSTNTAPYRVVVEPNGNARIEVSGQPAESKTLSKQSAKTLFSDVQAAMPLDAIKTEPCMKSASFGTSTHVTYMGKTSPDLSCASGKAAQRLNDDVDAVTVELKINPLRRASEGSNP